ncbi:MAG: HD domain-containing protein [Thermoanaerobaculia bacterium]
MTAAERFLALGPREIAERWLRDLETRYSEPHRHYHTRTHIEHMLELLPHADETVVAAVWFHDAIYDGYQNEERSAALAARAMGELGFTEEKTALVERMIVATKRHERDPPALRAACSGESGAGARRIGKCVILSRGDGEGPPASGASVAYRQGVLHRASPASNELIFVFFRINNLRDHFSHARSTQNRERVHLRSIGASRR